MKYRHIALLTALTLLCGCSGNVQSGALPTAESTEPLPAESSATAASQTASTTPRGTAEAVLPAATAETAEPSDEAADGELFHLNGDWCEPEELPFKVTRYSPRENSAHPELWEYVDGEKQLVSSTIITHITDDGVMILEKIEAPESSENDPYSQFNFDTVTTIYSYDPATDELKTIYSGNIVTTRIEQYSDEYCCAFDLHEDNSYDVMLISLLTGEARTIPHSGEHMVFCDFSSEIHTSGNYLYTTGHVDLPIENGTFFKEFRYDISTGTWSIFNNDGDKEPWDDITYTDGYDIKWDTPHERELGEHSYIGGSSYYPAHFTNSSTENGTVCTASFTGGSGSEITIGSTTNGIYTFYMTNNRIFLMNVRTGGTDYTMIAGTCPTGYSTSTAAVIATPGDPVTMRGMQYIKSDRIYIVDFRTLDCIELSY